MRTKFLIGLCEFRYGRITQKVVCVNLVLLLNFFILFSAGKFTFQCMLNKTGEIVFSYRKVKVDLKKYCARKH